MGAVVPTAAGPVLPTMNVDGSRRVLRPRLSRGRHWRRRLSVAWFLIGLFTMLPYVTVGGKPAILLDVPHRRFTVFGSTFLATDTALLMLLLVGIFVGIFLLTALLGRAWCGWACPQTVYMEFLYRPIERLFEGNRAHQLRLDREGPDWRRVAKNGAFLVASLLLAHTFLAYFVGVRELSRWVRQSPLEHPAAFVIVAVTTGLMFLDFAWFREQVCLVACPYGRFQSALLDRFSLIVGYDARRGEPRARLKGDRAAAGDCIDCSACVTTCPTGIDIRAGLQMECVHCTQCIDACDAVMAKIGKPQGLIRYGSRAELSGEPRRLLRPRVVVYPAILLVVFGLLAVTLAGRESAEVTVLRGLGAPYAALPDGSVSGAIRVKVVNRSDSDAVYTIELADADRAPLPEGALELLSPDNPLPVPAGQSATAPAFAVLPASAFGADGVREVRVRVSDGRGFSHEVPYRLLGPESR
jgi:cytochrome c oxidase accessory protein FixG